MDLRPKLYHELISYYSMIARLGLCEKGVPFQSQEMDIHLRLHHLSPQYARIQPNMTIPTLVHEEVIKTSSLDILYYVDSSFQGPPLQPQDLSRYPHMQLWLNLHYQEPYLIESLTFAHLNLCNPLLRRIIKKGLERQVKRIHQYSSENHDLTQFYLKKLALIEDRRQRFSPERLQKTYDSALQQIIQHLDKLEKQLQQQPWLTGAQYTLADIVWTVFLSRLFFIDQEKLVESRPAVYAYWRQVQRRPSFQAAQICSTLSATQIFKLLCAKIFSKNDLFD